MTERPLITSFADLGTYDRGTVGVYGKTLGDLLLAGVSVPHGFCVTTSAWSIVRATMRRRVEPLLRAVDACSADDTRRLRELSDALQGAVMETPLPRELEEMIARQLDRLGALQRFSVRPSPTVEEAWVDAPGAREGFLNVPREDVVATIRRCWAGQFSTEALAFRRRAHLSADSVSTAVLIQKMLHPRVSGVMSTADPTGHERGVATILATWGLWDERARASNRCDRYRVELETGRCLAAEVAEKRYAVVSSPERGTDEITVEVRRARSPVLDDSNLAEIAEIGRALQEHFDAPQEIQWCLVDDAYHVVQSQPIRAAFPIPASSRGHDDAVWLSLGHVFGNTAPVSPLTFDVWAAMGLSEGRLSYRGGRLFVDVAPLLSRTAYRKLAADFVHDLDPHAANLFRSWPVEGAFASRRPAVRMLRTKAVWEAVFRRDGVTRFDRRADELTTHASGLLENVDSEESRMVACREILASFGDELVRRRALPVLLAGSFALRILRRVVPDARAALRTFATTATPSLRGEMDREIAEVGELASRHPDLVAWLDAAASVDIDGGRMLPNTREFWSRWDRLVRRYGAHGANPVDIGALPWRLDARDLQSRIVAHATTSIRPDDGTRRLSDHEAARRELSAASRLSPAVTGWLLDQVVELVAVRRSLLRVLQETLDRVRSAFLEVGVSLVRSKQIAALDDVLWLRWEEIEAGARSPEPLRDLVALNRSRHLRFYELDPPRLITATGEIPALESEEFCMLSGVALER